MDRRELQEISRARIEEAQILLQNERFEGAYYLAGYAVECALKACIAKQTSEHDFPDLKFVRKIYTHNLEELLGLAGLREEFRTKASRDQNFRVNWAVVKDWSEEARYRAQVGEQKVRELVEAIVDETSGVLSWLKTLW